MSKHKRGTKSRPTYAVVSSAGVGRRHASHYLASLEALDLEGRGEIVEGVKKYRGATPVSMSEPRVMNARRRGSLARRASP